MLTDALSCTRFNCKAQAFLRFRWVWIRIRNVLQCVDSEAANYPKELMHLVYSTNDGHPTLFFTAALMLVLKNNAVPITSKAKVRYCICYPT
jgi:hypothetical protein